MRARGTPPRDADWRHTLASAPGIAFLPSTDLERSRRFFEDRLGLRLETLDWLQGPPHLGGPAGVALLARCIETGWLRRHPDRPRGIPLTERGRQAPPVALHLELP